MCLCVSVWRHVHPAVLRAVQVRHQHRQGQLRAGNGRGQHRGSQQAQARLIQNLRANVTHVEGA